MKTKDVSTALSRMMRQASDLDVQHVEELARKIMRKHKSITGFCLGMGSAAFYDADRHPLDHSDPRIQEMEDFISDWDRSIHITGHPMKINGPDGEKITDW